MGRAETQPISPKGQNHHGSAILNTLRAQLHVYEFFLLLQTKETLATLKPGQIQKDDFIIGTGMHSYICIPDFGK